MPSATDAFVAFVSELLSGPLRRYEGTPADRLRRYIASLDVEDLISRSEATTRGALYSYRQGLDEFVSNPDFDSDEARTALLPVLERLETQPIEPAPAGPVVVAPSEPPSMHSGTVRDPGDSAMPSAVSRGVLIFILLPAAGIRRLGSPA
jgi:hypothetical protein